MVFARQRRNRFQPYSMKWPQKPLKRKITAGKVKQMQQIGNYPIKIFEPWNSFSDIFPASFIFLCDLGKAKLEEREFLLALC